METKPETDIPPLRIDLGCGRRKKEGFTGVDSLAFVGVDVIHDLTVTPWPFADASVDEFHCSHFIEHLDWPQRVAFFNELFRVMKDGASGQIIFPHWSSMRFYGDPTHKAPMSEFAFYYLSKKWRDYDGNAPHADAECAPGPYGYACNFECTWGYSLHGSLTTRNQDYVQHAMQFWKEACQDIIATIKKVPMPTKPLTK